MKNSIENLRGKLTVFYGKYTLPISLACLKFLQDHFRKSYGLYFVAGRSLSPLHVKNLLAELDKQFVKRIRVIPLFNPLSQFIIVNLLGELLKNTPIEWVVFDNIIFNFCYLKGLVKKIKMYSLIFEEISMLKYNAKKYNKNITILACEESRAIFPINFLQKIADIVIKIDHENSKTTFYFEREHNDQIYR